MKPEPVPARLRRQVRRPDPGRLRCAAQLLEQRVGRLVLARERRLVRIDVLLHERAHLGAARLDVGPDRELGHGVESRT